MLRRLVPTVRATGLPREPFDRLVEANLQDQRVTAYPTWAALRGYCALSADPVGRIVLHLFGVDDPRAGALSDRVCTALQLLEHLQDVAEDRRAGRVYLPGRGPRRLRGRARRPRRGRVQRGGAAPGRASRPTGPRPCSTRARRCSGCCAAGRGSRSPATSPAAGRPCGRCAARARTCSPGSPRALRSDALRAGAGLLAGRPPREGWLEAAYARCEQITRQEARNFSYGIRLLPADKHDVLCAVYALARRVDDIGDGDLPLPEKRVRLAQVRVALQEAPAYEPDPVLAAVARRGAALPDAAGGVRGAGRGRRDGPVGTPLRDLRRAASTTAAAWPARSGGCAWASSAAARTPGPPATPTRSGSPCSRPTSCATSARTCSRPGLPAGRRARGVRRRPPGRAGRRARGPRRRARRAWCGPVPRGPAAGTTRACAWCRCWTAAAPPAARRWPGSTGTCWPGSTPTPGRCCVAACRCRAREKAAVAVRALAGRAP